MGKFLRAGGKYLLIGSSIDSLSYRGFVCDKFSHELNAPNNLPTINRLELIQHYFDLVSSKYTGKVELITDDILFATGQFLNGKATGEWQHYEPYRPKTRLSSKVDYKNGIYHGMATYYSTNTKIYFKKKEEIFEEGEFTEQRYYRLNQETPYLSFVVKNGILDGEKITHKTSYSKKGFLTMERTDFVQLIPQTREFRVANIQHNLFKSYHKNGQLKEEGNYYYGAKVGQWFYYLEDGNLDKEENYQMPASTKGDSVCFYYGNGNPYINGHLVNGKKEGIWRRFHEVGSLAIKGHFINDKPEGPYYSYHRKEQTISTIQHFKDGILQGPCTMYFKDGTTIRSTKEYIDGKIEGDVFTYFDNGQLEVKTEFVNGKAHGEQNYFYEDGRLKSTKKYVKGEAHGQYYFANRAGTRVESGKYDRDAKIGDEKIAYPKLGYYLIVSYELVNVVTPHSGNNSEVKHYEYFTLEGVPVSVEEFNRAYKKERDRLKGKE